MTPAWYSTHKLIKIPGPQIIEGGKYAEVAHQKNSLTEPSWFAFELALVSPKALARTNLRDLKFDLYPGGGGYSQKKWVGVCGPLPKTLTLFMSSLQANLRPKFAIFPTLFMSY